MFTLYSSVKPIPLNGQKTAFSQPPHENQVNERTRMGGFPRTSPPQTPSAWATQLLSSVCPCLPPPTGLLFLLPLPSGSPALGPSGSCVCPLGCWTCVWRICCQRRFVSQHLRWSSVCATLCCISGPRTEMGTGNVLAKCSTSSRAIITWSPDKVHTQPCTLLWVGADITVAPTAVPRRDCLHSFQLIYSAHCPSALHQAVLSAGDEASTSDQRPQVGASILAGAASQPGQHLSGSGKCLRTRGKHGQGRGSILYRAVRKDHLFSGDLNKTRGSCAVVWGTPTQAEGRNSSPGREEQAQSPQAYSVCPGSSESRSKGRGWLWWSWEAHGETRSWRAVKGKKGHKDWASVWSETGATAAS